MNFGRARELSQRADESMEESRCESMPGILCGLSRSYSTVVSCSAWTQLASPSSAPIIADISAATIHQLSPNILRSFPSTKRPTIRNEGLHSHDITFGVRELACRDFKQRPQSSTRRDRGRARCDAVDRPRISFPHRYPPHKQGHPQARQDLSR
jgi:hypothetical protein